MLRSPDRCDVSVGGFVSVGMFACLSFALLLSRRCFRVKGNIYLFTYLFAPVTRTVYLDCVGDIASCICPLLEMLELGRLQLTFVAIVVSLEGT